MKIEFHEPMVSISKKEFDERLKVKEQEVFKSFLLRLIHCTDNARYEEDMVDDYWALICELQREYKEKYGEEVE